MKSVADAKNQTTLYDYFKDDNLKQVTYSNAVIATPSVSLTYDTNYDRPLTITDGIGTTTYAYLTVTNGVLGAGRLASVDGPLANDTVSYYYDALGRITNRAINGVAQTVAYDALGRVIVVTNALGSFTNVYFGATERIATSFYPNGQKTVFSYYGTNDDLRLQTIWNQKPDGSTLSKFDYAYDADGQIKSWTQQADNGTPNVWVTEYDPVDQLLGVTVRSNSLTGTILKQFIYGYDKAGNRTGEKIYAGGTGVSMTKDIHNPLNQLTNLSVGGAMRFKGRLSEIGTATVAGSAATVNPANTNFIGYASVTNGANTVSIGAADYSGNNTNQDYEVNVTNVFTARVPLYDANGNMTNDGSFISYEYDAADRTVAINRGTTNRTEFIYDGFDRKVQSIEKTNGVATSTNKYVWCGLELCEERNNVGSTVTKRFFPKGEQISGTNYFFARDHLGSMREMTDTSGAIKARYDYDPYGRRTKVSGTMDADFGFTGHSMLASQLEHTFTLYRLYRPDLGRWLNRDPIHEAGGLNLFAFVANDPVNKYDMLGLAPKSPDMTPPPSNLEGGPYDKWCSDAGNRRGGAWYNAKGEYVNWDSKHGHWDRVFPDGSRIRYNSHGARLKPGQHTSSRPTRPQQRRSTGRGGGGVVSAAIGLYLAWRDYANAREAADELKKLNLQVMPLIRIPLDQPNDPAPTPYCRVLTE